MTNEKPLTTKEEKLPLVSPADYRHNCGRLLFRGVLMVGSRVEMRCPKCGKLAVYEALLPVKTVVVKEPRKEILTLTANLI